MGQKSSYKKVKHLEEKEKKRFSTLTKPREDLSLKCTKDHMSKNEAWHNMIWSGEKKFNLDDADGFYYYRHDLRKEEDIFSTRP